jgi:hypothetical protein
MLDIEVIGNKEAIEDVKQNSESFTSSRFRGYEEKGADGSAGVFGLVGELSKPLLPNLIGILKRALFADRNLEVKVNGLEFKVKDIEEASEVLTLLEKRGLLKQEEVNDP